MGASTSAGAALDYRSSLDALRSAQKPSRGTAAYSRLVNRPIARRVAAAAHQVGMTPNVATAISAALSATGLVLLATRPPSWLLGIAVAGLLAAGYVMDSVDGQLARLTGSGSVSGEWLDHTVDCVKTCGLHLAVLVAWYRFPPVDERAWLLVPLGFEIVDMVTFFGLIVLPLLRRLQTGAPPAASDATREHPLRQWIILPTDYGVFCLVFLVVGWPIGFLVAYSLLFLVNSAVLVLALTKWWRELAAFSRAEA